MKEKVIGFFSGIAYGIATAIPGLSGGTILVIFRCYDKVCEALALNLKAIKKNIVFLVIFGIGAVIGVTVLAYALTFMIGKFPLITYLILSVTILMGLPIVLKEVRTNPSSLRAKRSARNTDNREKRSIKSLIISIVPALIGCAFITAMMIAELLGISGISESSNMVLMIIISALAGFASIIPGISGAFILVMFGVYEPVLAAVVSLNYSVLAIVGFGAVIGIVCGSRFITLLLKKARTIVYSAIIGLIIGSAVMLAVSTIIKYG